MKPCFIFLWLLLPAVTIAQQVLYLDAGQPPELGFVLSNQESTIIRGDSVVLGDDLIITGGTAEFSFSWSPSSHLSDPSSPQPVASPPDTTRYFLTVTDQRGCSFQLVYTVNVTPPATGVPLSAVTSHIVATVFPNPCQSLLNVRIQGEPAGKIELTVTGNEGKALIRREISNFSGFHEETLQLNLPAGSYILMLKNENARVSRSFIIIGRR